MAESAAGADGKGRNKIQSIMRVINRFNIEVLPPKFKFSGLRHKEKWNHYGKILRCILATINNVSYKDYKHSNISSVTIPFVLPT
jgi:hypothetical protein